MDNRVRTVIALMETNLHRKLSAAEMARAVGLSAAHFREVFKRETGTPLMRYLRRLRMQHAKKLIETTFLSIKEIAARVGLNNISHFVRDFAKAYGRAPTEHRRIRRRVGYTKDKRGRAKQNP